MDLTRGQNAPLPPGTGAVEVRVGLASRAAGAELDLSALQLDADGRVLSDAAFVFYNQPTSPDGAVTLMSDGFAPKVQVALGRVAAECVRVCFILSFSTVAGDPLPFSRLPDISVEVQDADGNELFRFVPLHLTTETALILGEVYRRADDWKFRAVGQGYDNGLSGVARDFGVDIAEGPASADVVIARRPVAISGDGAPLSVPGPPAVSARAPVRQAELPTAPAPVTLWEAALMWNKVEGSNAEVLSAYVTSVQTAVAAMAASEPSLAEAFRDADAAAASLRSAFERVYGAELQSAKSNDRSAVPLDTWTRRTLALRDKIATTRMPLTRSNREKQKWSFSAEASALLANQSASEMRTLIDHHQSSSHVTVGAFRRSLAAEEPRLKSLTASLPTLPAVVGSLADADVLGSPPSPGAGPLVLRVGSIHPGPLDVTGRAPQVAGYANEREESARWEPAVSWQIPALIDMNLVSGIVTTDTPTVNTILLKLLALLPAGQLKMTMFDPVKLGDNARFIFGLGDAAAQVIGDKVRSTDRELADILMEFEEHLGFVTQKYLQGQYETLADYNEAAGEVAEPYRALVLYDFPNGFIRPGGRPDEELLTRLGKIIGSGIRCGVMTLVTSQTPELATESPVSRLYPLFPGVEMPHWQARNIACGIESKQPPEHLRVQVLRYSPTPLQRAARKPGVALYRSKIEGWYRFVPEPQPSTRVVAELLAGVERGLASMADVRVSLDQVCQLAIDKQERDVAKGTRKAETLPVAGDESTWWHGSAGDGIAGTFGRVGANELGVLELDSQIASGALIGGRMGSGKSVLLHAIILPLVMRYRPEELELYLVDFKEGVEFKGYAAERLPHARVVAVESEREFGLSVLKSLDAEITRRGALFRAGDGRELNLSQYRARSGEPLPRIVLLMDEFHVLFGQDDKIGSASADLMDRIVRQGRAFGVHVILASQTLSGAPALRRTTLGLVPIRIALQSSEADSRVLLADDNPDARLLTRPGEGLLNTKGGLRDANSRFQAAFTGPDERTSLLRRLRSMADRQGFAKRPVVFEGREPAPVHELPPDVLGLPFSRSAVQVPLGLPLTLDPPVTGGLRREPGGNLLLVLPEDTAYGPLALAMSSLLRSGARVSLLDYGPLDAPWEDQLSVLTKAGLDVRRRHAASAELESFRKLVEERVALNDVSSRPVVLVLAALHRARDFDTSSADGPEPEDLAVILREGPDVGVHVIAWCDKPVSVGRRLTGSMLREFALRLLGPMAKDDSFSLIDSDAASTLNTSQVVLDDHDRVITTRARRFALPTADELRRLLKAP